MTNKIHYTAREREILVIINVFKQSKFPSGSSLNILSKDHAVIDHLCMSLNIPYRQLQPLLKSIDINNEGLLQVAVLDRRLSAEDLFFDYSDAIGWLTGVGRHYREDLVYKKKQQQSNRILYDHSPITYNNGYKSKSKLIQKDHNNTHNNREHAGIWRMIVSILGKWLKWP